MSETTKEIAPTESGQIILEITSPDSCSSTSAPFNYVLTGINDERFKNEKQLYPNPTTDAVHVKEIENVEEIFVRDSRGRLLFKMKPENGLSTISLAGYPSGVYFVTLKSISGVNDFKILKK